MATSLNDFKKRREYLLCVDSDGCAMDTMNIKHFRCFGPCFVRAWGITEGADAVLKRWNDINLFELTRGINRFLGFARLSRELYPNDDDIKAFESWTRSAKELSENAVLSEWQRNGNRVFQLAYEWSRAVNRGIAALPEDVKVPFKGAAEALMAAGKRFDIAIVSSANYAAVTEEWKRCGLLAFTDAVATQQDGSKARCIAELIKKGYDRSKAVMVGDAPGDLNAAQSNGVAFYPILVGREKESWDGLNDMLAQFIADGAGSRLEELKSAFYKNLNA